MRIALFGKMGNVWGLEGLIAREIDRNCLKWYRIGNIEDFNNHPEFFSGYDALCFIQGRGINRQALLAKSSAKKVLVNAEFLPYHGEGENPESFARLELVQPITDFDLVLTGCQLNRKYLVDHNINSEWLPMMGVDPAIHRKMTDEPKEYDITFYGAPSHRRQRLWIDMLGKVSKYKPYVKATWFSAYGEDLVKAINQSRIVVNMHYADMLNTESRIYEVLGCGTLCLSEEISNPYQFLDGVHFVSCEKGNAGQMADKALELLSNDDKREAIAKSGHDYVHSRWTIGQYMSHLDKEISVLLRDKDPHVSKEKVLIKGGSRT
jgi:hypothetical protein